MATFQSRLKDLIEEKGITQKDLADEINTTKSTISRYLNNKREPKMYLLEKIANYFGVSVDYLLGRSDIKDPAEVVENAISNDPELLEFWNKIKKSQNKKKLIKQINKMEEVDEEFIRHIISTLQSFYKYKGENK